MSAPNVTHPHDMPTDLVPRVSLGTLSATTPDQLLSGAAAIAKPLARVIEDQKLYSVISGRRYVRVEGWTTLGALLGVVAREVSNVEHDGFYEATVELWRLPSAELPNGAFISGASAECGRDEPVWQKRPAYARRSMAATRATGKACRLAFSWVMTMAGFEATPAEEMDGVVLETAPAQTPAANAKTLRISAAQGKRLWAIAKSAGWEDADIKDVVKREAGVEHSKDIVLGGLKGQYDALIKIFEAGPALYDTTGLHESPDDSVVVPDAELGF